MTEAAKCPDCRRPMRGVFARARTGYLLALDQCAQCGGIWFDRWELFPLDHEEVPRLDRIDTERLRDPVESRPLGDCPRCEVQLREFHDANLPPDAKVARCYVCEGMWLQRGQLRAVKSGPREGSKALRHAGARSRDVKPEDAMLVELAKAYSADAKWSNVKELDAATYEMEEAPPGLEDIGEAAKSTLPWIVLKVLFRMLLRR